MSSVSLQFMHLRHSLPDIYQTVDILNASTLSLLQAQQLAFLKKKMICLLPFTAIDHSHSLSRRFQRADHNCCNTSPSLYLEIYGIYRRIRYLAFVKKSWTKLSISAITGHCEFNNKRISGLNKKVIVTCFSIVNPPYEILKNI